jgi:hypothetical protein
MSFLLTEVFMHKTTKQAAQMRGREGDSHLVKAYRPGEKVPISGQYAIMKNGRMTNDEVTSVSGKRFPPTQKPNQKFVLVDKTK